MRMSIAALSAAALLVPAVAGAQSRTVRQTVDLSAGGRLTLVADISDVHLTSWDREELEVVARIEAREPLSGDAAKQAVEATRIDVTGGAAARTVRANYDDVPRTSMWGGTSQILPKITYDIRAPRRLSLDLEIDRSTADIRGFDGTFDLHADRTELRAADLTGTVRLDIDRGGTTVFEGLRGQLTFDADRTNLRLDGFTLTGDSRVDVGRGDLDLRLASGAGLTLSLDRERRSQFDTELPLTTRSLDRDRVEGAVNGGGPRLSIGTDRAHVSLRAR